MKPGLRWLCQASGANLVSHISYAFGSANERTPGHVMPLLPTGMWPSKIGSLETIQHGIEDVVGDKYGQIHTFMSRRPSEA